MMRNLRATLLVLVSAGISIAMAADIEGTVVIQRKLTKRKVTANAAPYQRGVAVELGADTEQDPLAFERSHVAVYLEGNLQTKATTAVMEQKNRRFEPNLLVIPVGSTVSFPNLDPIFHNVFSLSKAKAFDLGNYPKDETRTVKFSTPGIVFVNCYLHPNMSAAIVVTPNEWSTRVDPAGHFTLTGIPPGRYTVVAWHKTAGFFRETVVVTASGTASVRFFIPIEAEPERISRVGK